MNTVGKVEKVSQLFQPGAEWLYGYAKSYCKIPIVAMGTNCESTTGERTKH
jgi:hypothetical protein